MKNKPITIYWAPYVSIDEDGSEWSFLYKKPNTLFDEMKKIRTDIDLKQSMFVCPVVSDKFKKILVFKNSLDFSYRYDFSNQNKIIEKTSEYSLNVLLQRDANIFSGPLFDFSLRYIFFASEPLDAYFTPPMFHEPKYTKYGSVIPGEFNIGNWFRPYAIEMQTWKNSGDIIFEKDEPLFYLELKTDKKFEIKQFVMSKKLTDYSKSCMQTTSFFGKGQTLLSRYNRFIDVGLREKILTEINKNLIEDFD